MAYREVEAEKYVAEVMSSVTDREFYDKLHEIRERGDDPVEMCNYILIYALKKGFVAGCKKTATTLFIRLENEVLAEGKRIRIWDKENLQKLKKEFDIE